jgi:hypothetical protein
MQIYTRKELEKWLKTYLKPNDPLFALIILKDEVEAKYEDIKFTNKQFIEACEMVDTESEEQSISEQIDNNLSEYIDEQQTCES